MKKSTRDIARKLGLNTIFLKISLIVAISSALVGVALAYLSMATSNKIIDSTVAYQAADMTKFTSDVLVGSFRANSRVGVERRLEGLLSEGEGKLRYAAAFATPRDTLFDGGSDADVLPDLQALALRAFETGEVQRSLDGTLIAQPVQADGNDKVLGVVALAWSAQQLRDVASKDQNLALVVAAVIFLISLVATTYVVWLTVARPLSGIKDAIDRVALEDYDTPIPSMTRGDELGGIAKSLCAFSNRLRDGVEQMRENLFRGTAFDRSSASLMLTDEALTITSCSPALLAVLRTHEGNFEQVARGFDPDNLIGESLLRVMPETTHDDVKRFLEGRGRTPFHDTIAVGDARFTLDINLVCDPEDTAMGYVVEWKDVTQETMNLAILSSIDSHQVKAEFSLSGHVLTSNALLRELLDKTADALTAMHVNDLFRFDPDLARERGPVFERLNDGESIYGRFEMQCDNGTIACVEGSFAPVLDSKGVLLRIVFLGKDV
ncbi:HAMP domain-containing protein, partial [uncultured Aliiroseovarius sp.]|uniref:HAMP domain-containing protein n=1 Tax=uncultured Aliiroseovarius sp. TaxID=1658783 RepID=UPI002621EABE